MKASQTCPGTSTERSVNNTMTQDHVNARHNNIFLENKTFAGLY